MSIINDPPATASQPTSPFLRELHAAVGSVMAQERTMTIEVGVMSAAGLTRSEIVHQLKRRHTDVNDDDVRMALTRLRRAASTWR